MKPRWRWIVLVGIGWLCGCKTPEPKGPLPPGALQQYFTRARDPRVYGITVYRSDHGAFFSGANRVHPEQQFFVRFEGNQLSTRPLIKVKIHGFVEHRVLLDTSSPQSWVAVAGAVDMDVVPLGPPAYPATADHVAGDAMGYAGVLGKLIFDQLHMEYTIFHVKTTDRGLVELARESTSPRPEAIVGCNILKNLSYVRFDFPGRRVVFSSTLPYKPGPTPKGKAMMVDREGAYVVQGRVNGRKTDVVLDTAGNYEVALPTATELPPSIELGTLVLRPTESIDRETAGLGPGRRVQIGRKLLANYKVTFDNQKRIVYFE